MSKNDQELLGWLAAGVALVYVCNLHWGGEFGWPALTTQDAPKKPAKERNPPPKPSGRTGAPGRPGGDGVIDVANPDVVSLEEYKRIQAARARAARARKPKP